MEPSRGSRLAGGGHFLRNRRGEGDHVVAGCFFDLEYAVDIETGVPAQFGRIGRGHYADFRQRFRRCQFHLQPLLELIAIGPDRAHFRTRVTGNQ